LIYLIVRNVWGITYVLQLLCPRWLSGQNSTGKGGRLIGRWYVTACGLIGLEIQRYLLRHRKVKALPKVVPKLDSPLRRGFLLAYHSVTLLLSLSFISWLYCRRTCRLTAIDHLIHILKNSFYESRSHSFYFPYIIQSHISNHNQEIKITSIIKHNTKYLRKTLPFPIHY
jgi:hypothetical protein